MPDGPLQLTREELYDLVWSEPMIVLATRFGISDRGLGKICERYEVPKPGRGYWGRTKKRRPARRPPLPPMRDQRRPPVIRLPGPRTSMVEPEAVAKQRHFESLEENRIVVPEKVGRYHPLLRQTRVALRARRRDRTGADNADPIPFDVNVSRASLPRALRIMDALIKALERRAMSMQIDRRTGRGVVEVSGVAIKIRLRERYEQVRLPRRSPGSASESLYGFRLGDTPRYESRATGRLALEIDEWPGTGLRKTWADGKRQRVEDCLNAFVVGLVAVAEGKKEAERERQELERRRLAERILREELRQLELRQSARVEDLRRQAASWNEARQFKEYIAAVREATRDCDPALAERRDRWLGWAEDYIEGLDPLHDLGAVLSI